MKKNRSLFVLCIYVAALLIFVSCSSTPPNQQDFATGKYLKDVFTDHYDSSIPVEEHCYVVNLAIGSRFTTFDGEKAKNGLGVVGSLYASVGLNNIMIVPPGKHRFAFIYQRQTGPDSYTEASDSFTYEFKAGNYYFLASSVDVRFNIDTNKIVDNVSWLFGNLEDYTDVLVYSNNSNATAMMPVEAIISGINAKISSKFKNFNPPLKR